MNVHILRSDLLDLLPLDWNNNQQQNEGLQPMPAFNLSITKKIHHLECPMSVALSSEPRRLGSHILTCRHLQSS